MYPGEQLKELALRKEALRCRIALERAECALSLRTVCRPIALVDTVVTAWSQLPGLVRALAVPIGGFVMRWAMPRLFGNAGPLRWSSLALGVLRHAFRT